MHLVGVRQIRILDLNSIVKSCVWILSKFGEKLFLHCYWKHWKDLSAKEQNSLPNRAAYVYFSMSWMYSCRMLAQRVKILRAMSFIIYLYKYSNQNEKPSMVRLLMGCFKRKEEDWLQTLIIAFFRHQYGIAGVSYGKGFFWYLKRLDFVSWQVLSLISSKENIFSYSYSPINLWEKCIFRMFSGLWKWGWLHFLLALGLLEHCDFQNKNRRASSENMYCLNVQPHDQFLYLVQGFILWCNAWLEHLPNIFNLVKFFHGISWKSQNFHPKDKRISLSKFTLTVCALTAYLGTCAFSWSRHKDGTLSKNKYFRLRAMKMESIPRISSTLGLVSTIGLQEKNSSKGPHLTLNSVFSNRTQV